MEVGAVKQAFNNEVILLKKKLNQAKIHVIHKLTRKAKTLTEKKIPEHLKEKMKRKAEYAINEVLIIKKIKARDIAKFIITHTGEVQEYLNRPKVDNDKACARLVLHKSLQDKYKFIRNRFGNVPIKDLFMSRQERRKLKKEAREQQKNKKKGKEGKLVNAVGDWDVEDVEIGDESKDSQYKIDSDDKGANDESEHSVENDSDNNSEAEDQDVECGINDSEENLPSDKDHSDDEALDNSGKDDDSEGGDDSNNDDDGEEVRKYIKLKPEKEIKKPVQKPKPLTGQNLGKLEVPEIDTLMPQKKQMDKKRKETKQKDKKVKENKNKNLKEKLQNRKFKKDEDDTEIEGRKVVDPFFITATGENYLSLAEPREPDEVKEVHRQGNRQERRAAMFGHVAKTKPRRDDFRQNNFKSNKFENGFRNRNDKFNNSSNFNDRTSMFNKRNNEFNDRNTKFNNKNNKFNDGKSNFSNGSFNNSRNDEKKEEKLHPSWEAKRKLKSMSLLPSQGKKIVFDDN